MRLSNGTPPVLLRLTPDDAEALRRLGMFGPTAVEASVLRIRRFASSELFSETLLRAGDVRVVALLREKGLAGCAAVLERINRCLAQRANIVVRDLELLIRSLAAEKDPVAIRRAFAAAAEEARHQAPACGVSSRDTFVSVSHQCLRFLLDDENPRYALESDERATRSLRAVARRYNRRTMPSKLRLMLKCLEGLADEAPGAGGA